jgi:hypothetical protein
MPALAAFGAASLVLLVLAVVGRLARPTTTAASTVTVMATSDGLTLEPSAALALKLGAPVLVCRFCGWRVVGATLPAPGAVRDEPPFHECAAAAALLEKR